MTSHKLSKLGKMFLGKRISNTRVESYRYKRRENFQKKGAEGILCII